MQYGNLTVRRKLEAMGRVKDWYIDNIMNVQHWVSTVQFECPKCHAANEQEVGVPEPNYAAEKSRDMTSEGEVELICESCDAVFDAEAWSGPAHCDIELRDYPNAKVVCDAPGYDQPPEDWDIWDIPESPFNVFQRNATELKAIIASQASKDGSSLINRMIFAQVLTFLEAYLCDNLIKMLRDHPDRMIAFAEKDGAIKDAHIPASEVLRDPNAVTKWIERNLRNRLYHQFGSSALDKKTGKPKQEGVVLWYAMAFQFSLTPTDSDLDLLRKQAILRHDCVHRNGVTKDGDTLDIFEPAFLLKTLEMTEGVVKHINDKMDAL